MADVPPIALEEQRRLVTVLFADLAASTALGDKRDPEDLREILTGFFTVLAGQIQRYKGTVDKYVGDAVMAVFGAPVSHEGDAERAIRAGLGMQAAIATLNDELERTHSARLALRVGIHSGEVVAGLVADGVQHAYTVVGDVVNTAKRFESASSEGVVLVSDATRHLAREAFIFEALPATSMKGKTELVVPYRVVRSRDDEVLPELGRMVDAANELERLRAAFARAVLGNGCAVDVTGVAGVGKSRLLLEFRRGIKPGIQRVVARAASYQGETPYALLADLIRSMFGVHLADPESAAQEALVAGFARLHEHLDPQVLPTLLGILGYGKRSTLAATRMRELLATTLRGLVARASEHTPIVIVVEDLQWADRPSIAILAELASDLPRLACVLVTTSRTDTAIPWLAERIELAPLSEADRRELANEVARSLAIEAIAPDRLERLLERTQGNPFFIEELMRALGKAGETRVPDKVQELIQAHLDRLAPGPLLVLKTAAVIGRSFWLPLIKELVPSATLVEDLALLEREGFLVRRTIRPELTYSFRQPLLQEVAYNIQLGRARHTLHARVAEAIESLYTGRLDEFTDALAYHWARSDNRRKALVWLVAAGDRARTLYANEEALSSYRAALSRADDGIDKHGAATLLEHIADIDMVIGNYAEAITSLHEARERGAKTEAVVEARLLRKIGAAHRLKGALDDARAAFAAARAVLADKENPEAARVQLAEAMASFYRGEYDVARALFEPALEVGRRLGVTQIVAEGLKILGNIENNQGNLREAHAAYRESLDLYQQAGDLLGVADLHSNLGIIARRTGQHEEALEHNRQALDARDRSGYRWGVATSHNNMGELLRTMGRPEEAIPEYEHAAEIWDAIDAKEGAAMARMNLGAARVEVGKLERARADLDVALAALVALPGTKFLPSLHREFAILELAEGHIDVAAREAERSLSLAQARRARQVEAQAERILAEIARERGDLPLAERLLTKSTATFTELGETTELARLDAVLTRVRAYRERLKSSRLSPS